MLITDAQIHVWEIDRPDRPWPGGRNQPQLPNGFSAEQALAAMDEAGVDRAVIVPPTWVGENNLTGLEVAMQYPQRFAVMGRFDPTWPDAETRLQTWLDQPGMLGIRMTYRIKPYSDWLDDGSLEWFWSACERYDIPVMNLVSGIVEKLAPVANSHPDLRLIVDHFGVPLEEKGAGAFAGLEKLLALAIYPNVYVKVSSAPNFSNQPYPFADIAPYIRRIYDAFGAQRLMWGADLTRLASTYRECLDHFRQDLDFLSETDREWILGKTTAEVLDWPEES